MNPSIKNLLRMSEAEKRYWPMIVQMRTTEWSELDKLTAVQLCRDLSIIEEMARADVSTDLIQSLCRQVWEYARMLKLNPSKATAREEGTPQRIVTAIFEGFNAA